MTNKQLLALTLALQSLVNWNSPRKSAGAVKELWNKLAPQQRAWLSPRLAVPDKILKLMETLNGLPRPVFGTVIGRLSRTDAGSLLVGMIAIALRASGICPLRAHEPTGLITPASMTENGRFQATL